MREYIEELRKNKGVREKVFGNISSFNFTRKVFYNRKWNNMTIQARGLFIDTEDERIVARGYNKFFNEEEVEETKRENLKKNLKFPIEVYLKENGFLGMLSYNRKTNELMFATKSAIEGEHVDYFKSLADNLWSNEQIECIKAYLEMNDVTLVFEVIDIVNDLHIIEYKESQIILLDVVKNSREFKVYDCEEIADIFDIPCKKLVKVIESWEEYEEWRRDCQDFIEGYVVRDSENFMFKIKTDYYKFWKYLRRVVDDVKKDRDVFERYAYKDNWAFRLFYEWLKKNGEILEDIDEIIVLRNMYIKELERDDI